jgi:hypothetical protein
VQLTGGKGDVAGPVGNGFGHEVILPEETEIGKSRPQFGGFDTCD